jgi:hypothetical protein
MVYYVDKAISYTKTAFGDSDPRATSRLSKSINAFFVD